MSYSTQQNPGIISNVQSNVGSFGEEMKKKVFGLGDQISSFFKSNTPVYPNDGPLTGGKKKNPKKGQTSKTRKGRLDFVTHKGDKYFNRKNKRQTKTVKGLKKKPYVKGNPKKGQASKTRKGRLDFVTHKGDKYFNRKNKRQTKSVKGEKGTPYLLNGFM
jgi:hypothetical protein